MTAASTAAATVAPLPPRLLPPSLPPPAPLEEVQRYVITGEQYNYDSETSTEVRIEVSGTSYALETNGLLTVVRVRAVDEEGNALSKPSNTVEISGT